MTAEVLLEARDVRKTFGGFRAVDGVSLTVAAHEIVGLIGPNGAGKSTLFNVLSGFLRPSSGSIRFAGQALEHLPPYAPARLGMARTFQITRVFKRMTVRENLLFTALDQPGERFFNLFLSPRAVRAAEARNRERAEELIGYFGLAAVADEFAGALSGGQRKLLEMARALMLEPRLILLDEPMAGVNPALKEQLLHYILDLRGKGTTFLVVEHDMDMISRICDRVLVMAEGRLIASGSPSDVRRNQAVIDAYLGSA